MVLKYGEIYVYHNQSEESIGNTLWRFFGWETPVDKTSQILMIFDETNELFDVNEYLSRPNTASKIIVSFSHKPLCELPKSFTNSAGKIANYKEPIKSNGVKKQCFNNIFKNYKLKTLEKVASVYNLIYMFNSKEVFVTLRIKSTEEKPRFIFAFDPDFLSNTDVVHLVNLLFRL